MDAINGYKSATIVDWLEDVIITHIREKGLKAGDEILTEAELASKYDVGRNAVREALSRLRMLGIVESRQRRGMVVASPNITYNFNKVIIPNVLSKDTIIELLGIRVFLEMGSADTIVKNVTDEDICELRALVAREQGWDSIRVDVELETAFHSKIYSIARNGIMMDFLRILIPIFKFVNDHYEDFDAFNIPGSKKNPIRHKDLVDQLERRDSEGYKNAVEGHLASYINFIQHYSEKKNNELIND